MSTALALTRYRPVATSRSTVYSGRAASQPWPVSGWIRDRFLVTFSAPARRLARLVPAPFEVDALAGQGFVSVCALEAERMGLWGAPFPLRFHNLEFLYRIGVTLLGEPSFLTFRSDVSAKAMALLGARFSHYRPRLARFEHKRGGAVWSLACASADGDADAELAVPMAPSSAAPHSSLFSSAEQASAFLVGMKGSAALREDGRVQFQPIDHSPWRARFVAPTVRTFGFLERLEAEAGAKLTYDSTLHMQGISQRWGATRVR
jgi:uncharacterized protein DUF2071